MIKVKDSTCFISIILAFAAFVLAFVCIISSNENGPCELLCTAVCVTEINDNVGSVDLIVPANSRITKIYTSMQQEDNVPIDGGLISIQNTTTGDPIFFHRFGKDPLIGSGGYETTLVQPLFVGTEDIEVRFSSYFGDTIEQAEFLEITVVYCPAAE